MSHLKIRPADLADFEFVVNLMDEALTPYYGGDHRGHAKRIFEAHVAGGADRLGFFSMEQAMFVGEYGSERVGLVHVVAKRQGTVKISPLIVSPDYQGRAGVGSALLLHAEEYARNRSARTIYCTVAEQNTLAFNFFLRNGYVRAGRSPSHYKDGITETMMYKSINDEVADVFDRDHISVLPMENEQRSDVRKMLLDILPKDFMEIDESWVSNLFDGYDRRNSRDINLKYKLIFTALDRTNKVRGVAGATPKKGEPIKLMPLVASDDPAFFALLSDVPQRLADYGRKVYAHIVPTSRQTRFLQKAGWVLDGILPEAYQHGIVTQQWSIDTQAISKMKTIRLKQKYLNYIRSGKKTLEVRVAYSHIRDLRKNENIEFLSRDDTLVARINDIRSYPSFDAMLATEDHRRIVPDLEKPAVLDLLRTIYPTAKERLGVVVLEVDAART